ncbi:MAG: IclR family transcriptional regulator [Acidimicrobiales bacterium]
MAVQSVDRALSLLEVIAQRTRGLADAADSTGLPLSTAARLLGTLEERGAVTRDERGRYAIGALVRGLAGGDRSTASIQDAAHLELVRLSGALDEAVCLSLPIGHETLTVFQTDQPRPVQAQDWTGHRWAVTGGGSGAVMMATWPSSRVEPLLAHLGEAEQRRAREEIARARGLGVSWSHGTHVDGLSSVAAAVVDRSGLAVAAVVGYGPSYRFPPEGGARAVEGHVVEAAAAISKKLEV